MMNYYSVYGLVVQSELVLSDLPAVQRAGLQGDVAFRLTDRLLHHLDARKLNLWQGLDRSEGMLVVPDVGVFLVRDGLEVEISLVDQAPSGLVNDLLLGQVMAVLLFQRGHLVLHAGTADLAGNAVAFTGNSGSGKSTLLASLAQRGHLILNDDVSPVRWGYEGTSQECPMVIPGVQRLKLDPEITQSLGIAKRELFALGEYEAKKGWLPNQPDSSGSLPLQAIYFLETGGARQITRLNRQQAFFELLRQTLPTRMGGNSDRPHFEQCAQLLSQVPVYRLTRPVRQTDPLIAAEMLEEHFLNRHYAAN